MNDDKVFIFDTTLRDGEQCPGASMTASEKLAVAEALDTLGVDVIEAGFPASSQGDFEAVSNVARIVRNSTVCALSRSRVDDIDAAAAALAPARGKRIHTFISTSPLHMKYKLQLEPHEVLESINTAVSHARNLCDDVEWSCEDGTRSDFEFLCRCFDTAIRAGATTVNIADTVGYILPEEFHDLVLRLRGSVAGMERVRFSVHCHDDLGLATSNSLAAIRAGARQVECTINGIGERAGNASLEEIVMAIYTRRDELKVRTGVNTEYLTRASQIVAGVTGFTVPPNKAVVGSNAFAHESGIHQHGVLMNRGTYEIMDPEKVGASGSLLVMGKHSGRHAFRARLDALGISVSENQLQDLFVRFKALADERKVVDDQEIISLTEEVADHKRRSPVLQGMSVEIAGNGQAVAQVTVERSGSPTQGVGTGPSAFEALAAALRVAVPHDMRLGGVGVVAVSGSVPPNVKITVRLDGPRSSHVIGQGISPDPNVAFARGYLSAMAAAETAPRASGD